jgi:succinate dehydrogenase / fumarate reductase, cytochrome b subunit
MSKVVTFPKILPPFFHSSILQKALVAGSGSLLIVFTIVHLLGNLQIVLGDRDRFNLYAAYLNSLPSLHLALELVLLAALGIHVGGAIAIARRNRQAKPQAYVATPWWRSLTDRTMLYTGPLLLVFLGIHLHHFRFGSIDRYQIEILDRSLPDWQSFVTDTFKQVSFTSFYIGMMIPFGLHLRHGVQSAAQSLGAVSNPWLERGSWLLAGVLAIGFATIPAWIYYSQR